MVCLEKGSTLARRRWRVFWRATGHVRIRWRATQDAGKRAERLARMSEDWIHAHQRRRDENDTQRGRVPRCDDDQSQPHPQAAPPASDAYRGDRRNASDQAAPNAPNAPLHVEERAPLETHTVAALYGVGDYTTDAHELFVLRRLYATDAAASLFLRE